MESSIRIQSPPDVWLAAERSDQPAAPLRSYLHEDAASLSTSSTNTQEEDLEKQKQASASSSPSSLLARLNPNTWSRKMRLFALAGLVVATLGLVPAIAVPLALEHSRQEGGGSAPAAPAQPLQGAAVPAMGQPGAPLYVNPPGTSLVAAGVPLRIMALGASITYGFLSTDGNGYREDLLGLLAQGGNQAVTYVGSRRNGTMAENAVEGWPGLRIDQVLPKARDAVPRLRPNVVLVNAGTNDCVQDFDVDNTTQPIPAEPALAADPSNGVGTRLRAMVEEVLDLSPGATVVVSTLVGNRDPAVDARVADANGQFRAVAAALQAEGRRVVLADMDAAVGGPNATTMADNTHPNDVGYALMANRWYVALQEASDKGLIVAPDATSA